MTLRYVIHDDIKKYEKNGWVIVSHLSYPHSQHAVLMKLEAETSMFYKLKD